MSFTRINSGSTITGTFEAGADSFFEVARANDDCLVFGFIPLGGSRKDSVAGTGYQDADDYVPFELPDSASTGGTWNAIVDLLCEDGSTTITPKIRNITDSSDAVVGSASSSTSWARQTLAFTPASGKEYRLMFVKSDDLHKCFGIGWARRTAS